ncbi:MAG: hypothetical protein ACYC9Z_07735 [Casimicrobiaceae bacterium]
MSSEPGALQRQVAPWLAEMEAAANVHDTDCHLVAYSRDSALTIIINGEIIRGWDALHGAAGQRLVPKHGQRVRVLEMTL